MADIGKFAWNKNSANLSYSMDLNNRLVRFESFDETGYDFLSRLNVGREIFLYKSNGDVLNIVVRELKDIDGRIKGQASIQ